MIETTMVRVDRARKIQTALDEHFLTVVETEVASPEPTWWREHAATGELGPLAVLGFAHPVPNVGDRAEVIVSYSPEAINEQTQDLSDDELAVYLEAIEWYVDMHVVYWDEEPDADVRHRRIMGEFEREHPVEHGLITGQLVLLEFRHQLDDDHDRRG